MQIKSLLGALAIAASAVGAQTPQAASKAPAKAAAKSPSAAAGYKKELPAKLVAKAKITESAAAATALAKVPGGKIESVELEEEDGKLIYSYDIKVAGKKGIEEIQVDAISGAIAKAEHEDPAAEWQAIFAVDKSTLASTGRNQFFVLEPGHVSVFDGAGTHLVITVLAKTELVDGVTTRVVEERETKDGALVEISRNYFVISDRDSAVYYFGENVDMYKGGKVVSHEGSWRSGVDGARFGLMMAAHPVLGMRYQQEVAPKVAMDRVEFVSTTDAVKVPAGSYTGCIRTEETTPLEPGAKEYKRYCPGVGLVEDGDLKLVQLPGAPAKKP